MRKTNTLTVLMRIGLLAVAACKRTSGWKTDGAAIVEAAAVCCCCVSLVVVDVVDGCECEPLVVVYWWWWLTGLLMVAVVTSADAPLAVVATAGAFVAATVFATVGGRAVVKVPVLLPLLKLVAVLLTALGMADVGGRYEAVWGSF